MEIRSVRLGEIDALKVRSCMTLFMLVAGEGTVFQKVLDKIVRVVKILP